jgi:hypothetical protein
MAAKTLPGALALTIINYKIGGVVEYIRDRAKSLTTRISESYYELGGVLEVIATSEPPLYEEWEYSTFRDYVSIELGMSSRHVMRLRFTWRTLSALKVPKSKIRKLLRSGFSKVKEICKVLTKENIDQWIELAERESYVNIAELVKSQLAGDVFKAKTSFLAQLDKKQEKLIKRALNVALKHELGGRSKGSRLAYICKVFIESVRTKNR